MVPDVQSLLFQRIKSTLPEHISLADELAALLEVSTDSAYRRIRGEKALSLEEAYRICSRFGISLDSLMNLQSEGFLFTGSFVKPSTFQFDQYLQGVVGHMKFIDGFKEKTIYYLCKDVPLFHHFQIREFAAFKYLFWMKSILQLPLFMKRKFSFRDYPDLYFELSKAALNYYNQADSIELWNIETINSTIRQIEFHHETGSFESEEDVYRIYDSLERVVDHLQVQAEAGYKFDIDDPQKKPMGKFSMYFNEVMMGDNSNLAVMDGFKMSFLNHNTVNIMATKDVRFTEYTQDQMHNLMKMSTLISECSERERSRFFKYMRQRISSRKQNLKV